MTKTDKLHYLMDSLNWLKCNILNGEGIYSERWGRTCYSYYGQKASRAFVTSHCMCVNLILCWAGYKIRLETTKIHSSTVWALKVIGEDVE